MRGRDSVLLRKIKTILRSPFPGLGESCMKTQKRVLRPEHPFGMISFQYSRR